MCSRSAARAVFREEKGQHAFLLPPVLEICGSLSGRVARHQKEKQRLDRLLSEAKALREAEEIRAYVASVRKLNENAVNPVPEDDLRNWALWALEQADRIDPVRSRRFLIDRCSLDVELRRAAPFVASLNCLPAKALIERLEEEDSRCLAQYLHDRFGPGGRGGC